MRASTSTKVKSKKLPPIFIYLYKKVKTKSTGSVNTIKRQKYKVKSYHVFIFLYKKFKTKSTGSVNSIFALQFVHSKRTSTWKEQKVQSKK